MSATHLYFKFYYTSLSVHLSAWANCLWKSEGNPWGESLIPPCGSLEPNSGYEAWQQTDYLHNFGFQVNDTSS